ncbi:hypothetical protein [Streptomyces halobius]|nr:hypothetical protein [Streptomyces halobius]
MADDSEELFRDALKAGLAQSGPAVRFGGLFVLLLLPFLNA